MTTTTTPTTPPAATATASAAERRELLAHRLRRRLEAAVVEHAPSRGQQALWFLHRGAPESAAYTMAFATRLRGPVAVPALRRALETLQLRHGSLRTTFPEADGRPRARVGWPPLAWEERRLAAGSEAELEGAVVSAARRPFDLERGPLFRATLFSRPVSGPGDEEHVLLLGLHHAIADGWSLAVLLDELRQLYVGEISAAPPAALAAPGPSFADYVRWQEERLAGEAGERAWHHWRRHLTADGNLALPVLELPLDRPRPAVRALDGEAVPVAVDAATAAGLEATARRLGVTLSTLLLAAFQVLLHRWSGQPSIVVGTPAAARGDGGWDRLVGYCSNPIALRGELGDDPTFTAFARRLATAMNAGLEHQDYPFPLLVQRLEPQRDPARSPVFQAFFVFKREASPPGARADSAPDADAWEALRPEAFPVPQLAGQFELTLDVVATPGGLRCALLYDRELFVAASAQAIAASLATLLAGVVADPEVAVSALPLLDAVARRRWRLCGADATADEATADEATAAATAATRARPVDAALAHWARTTPDAPAVSGDGETLTYAELDRRTSELARRLRRRGVGPEEVVGVAVERSPAMLVALLAVHRAGGAYLPLDPAFPPRRLAAMLDDAGVRHLVASPAAIGSLPAERRSTAIDVAPGAEAAERDAPRAVDAGPDAAAYVLYTSGSTGRPKGVVVSFGALGGFLAATQRLLGLAPGDRWLAVTTISFDIAGLELFLPLLAGAEVVVASAEESGDGERLARLLAERRIRVLQATPASWRLLLAAGWSGHRELTMLAGGEALPRDLAIALLARGGRLWNLYGPTETTVWSSAAAVDAATAAADPPIDPMPLGAPLANTALYVVDRHLQPLPPGAIGELAIGGRGLARGYRGQPATTADRFRPDPFSGVPGARLYRTGDRVRRRPDGLLEFHGRADQQVKVHGFRIEVGEVEAALREHPAVAAAAVARLGDGGDARLVAGLVLAAAATMPPAEALRSHLGERLPRYMLPAAFVPLAALPLTANGKLDRGALAGLLAAPAVARAPRPPATASEEQVAAIWCEVLEIDAVGADDDFFADAGGHSLVAAQVLARLRAATGVDLPLRTLFEEPTVARLAALVDRRRAARADDDPTPLVRRPAGEAPVPSFAQERLWFLDRYEPDSAFYAMPVALRFRGDLDVEALAAALGDLVRRHETLRTAFVEVDGQPRLELAAPSRTRRPPLRTEDGAQRLEPEGRHLSTARRAVGAADFYHGPLDLPVVELTADEVAAAARAEAARPFDLSRPPLLRARLFRLPGHGAVAEHVLVVTVHHIASDGWSTQVMVREVAALYEARRRGEPSPLPELPVQYADYAAWQRRLATGEGLGPALDYWRRRLAGVPPLELPTDRPRPAEQSFRGRTVELHLPGPLVAALGELAGRHGATLFMALLAGFQALLGRLSGQRDFAVGTPVANRPRVELEGLIGFFVNMLALRADLDGDPSFDDLVARARETVLAAHAHQALPFERLVDALALPRDLGRAPLFQAVLVLHPRPRRAVTLPGLEVSRVALDTGTAKFDLALALTDTGDGLAGELEVAADLFDEATARRFAARVHRLLEAAVSSPATRLSELDLVTPEERRRLLVEWNDTAAPIPAEPVHRWIAARAAASPATPAVVCGDEAWTYGELWRWVRGLAAALAHAGVGPETRVGICLERSPAMVVAVLAVLEAGGTYLPLDPAYPAERLRHLLADARPAVVITAGTAAERLPAGEHRALPPDAAAPLRDFPAPLPDRAAYVLHTSGSTGRPKGVVVPHRALANFLATMAHRPGLGAGDTLVAVTSLSFDISALELLLPLTVGARLVVARRDEAADGAALGALLGRHAATAMQATPATWRLLLGAGWTGDRGFTALCGGEALPRELAARLGERVAALWNLYGPTETTIWSAVQPFVPDDAADPVAIGRPIANTRLHVLDAALRPVPAGVPGELFIGGVGLARGYLGRPGATAERFVPDPFVAGERLYCTGDRVRQRDDGTILYLDRLDRQVKVRGFRVELGEVETALAAHPAVAQAAVVCRDDASGERLLAAYVVLDEAAARLGEEAETALQAEQVTAWSSLWDETYGQDVGEIGDGLDTVGWRSSFDGQPIPATVMRRWCDERVTRIRALGGRRLWEIGCGSGLLVEALIGDDGTDGCERYLATDVAPAAVARLRRRLERRGPLPAALTLAARPADDFTGIAPGSFDTVVVNSVAQYFPDLAYLERVLRGALTALRPGGALYLGDLRSLPLLEAFHLAVLAAGEGRPQPAAELRRQLVTAVAEEEELLLDPAYFAGLATRLPEVGGCEILLQRAGDSEMGRFRYDAVVYRGPLPPAVASDAGRDPRLAVRGETPTRKRRPPLRPEDGAQRLEPEGRHLSTARRAAGAADLYHGLLDPIAAALAERPDRLELRDLPNLRLRTDVERLRRLHQAPDDAEVDLRQLGTDAGEAIDPATLWELGEAAGYRVRARPAPEADRFDVLFELASEDAAGERPPPWPWRIAAPTAAVANQPLRASRERRLLPELRAFLAARLPAHAVPSIWTRLDRLPLTPNGKIDRQSLARRDDGAPPRDAAGRAPASQLEERIAAVWREVLRRPFVGADDNFFEIGGHSLLAARAQGRLREAGLELAVIDLFRHPTVAGLARHLAARGAEEPAADGVSAGEATERAERRVASRERVAASRRARLGSRGGEGAR